MCKMCEGPLLAPSGGVVPGTDTYVVLYQERSQYGLTYCVEYGDTEFGHRGTWGRDNLADALEVFDSAWVWQYDNCQRVRV